MNINKEKTFGLTELIYGQSEIGRRFLSRCDERERLRIEQHLHSDSLKKLGFVDLKQQEEKAAAAKKIDAAKVKKAKDKGIAT